MTRLITLCGVLAVAISLLMPVASGWSPRAGEPPTTAKAAGEFAPVDVFIDCGVTPLAAWQVEVTPRAEKEGVRVVLVGIEGGDAGVYEKPAHYDPTALASDGGEGAGRVVLAAFSTADVSKLPSGRVRVARLHVLVEGVEVDAAGAAAARFDVTVRVAADHEAKEIAGARAEAAWVEGGATTGSGG